MAPTLEKLNRKVSNLQEEIRILRSFVIGMIERKDSEGEYKPEFVKKVLKTYSEDVPLVFKDKKSFLAKLKS